MKSLNSFHMSTWMPQGTMIGVEVLLRRGVRTTWYGQLNEFIPIAEQTGLAL
ncbi:hypothetical protein OH492_23785 [Vibrio chagasii]|nr:hypothetical protein [Vibrio chagasii]